MAFAVKVLQEDFGDLLNNEQVLVDIYLTKESASSLTDLGGLPKTVRVHYGRPQVRPEVEDLARNCRGRSLAVIACGPARMADDARKAVVDALSRGRPAIEYFEESFNW